MPAATSSAPGRPPSRSPAARCCLRSPAPSPRPGPRTCRARRCSRGPSGRATRTSRTARGCGSRSGGCASRSRRWPGSSATSRGFLLRPRPGAVGRRARAARRGGPRRGPGPARRWRGLVELGAGARPRRQPPHRPARARGAGRSRQGRILRPWPGLPLDGAERAGFPDELVTPGAARARLGCGHEAHARRNPPRIWPLPGNRERGRGQLRRAAGLVRLRRPAERPRPGERGHRRRARRRRAMRGRRSTASICSRSPRR